MILVTGGCGYIGSHTIIELLQNNYEVIVIDNFHNSDRNIASIINKISNKKIQIIEVDIRNYNELARVFEHYDIDSVFHFAGLKSIKESNVYPDLYNDVNCIGSSNILDIMVKKKIYKFIFSSSALVYGEHKILPWKENTNNLKPISPYAKSKLEVELMLKKKFNANKNWNIGILRYFNPMGSHTTGLLGDNGKFSDNLVTNIYDVILGKKSFLEIYGSDYETKDGTGVRDYIHINDLVSGHMKSFSFIKKNGGYNIWNLGTGLHYSVLDVVKAFEKNLNTNIPYKIIERRENDLGQYWADTRKANTELEWKPKLNLTDMVRDAARFIKK